MPVLRSIIISFLFLNSLATTLFAQDLSLAPTNSHSDALNLHFEHLTIDDGLSQSTVYSVIQDRHGFMWIATGEGLDRYDGYSFQSYTYDPNDSQSLTGARDLTTLMEDSKGMLWIGSGSSGLSRFDSGREVFVHYVSDDTNPNSLSNNNIRALLEDSAGVMWIGTEAGLNRFDSASRTFTRFFPVPGALVHPSNEILSLHQDKTGILWVGTKEGLFSFDRDTKTFSLYLPEPKEGLDSNWISDIYEDNEGTLWIGAWGVHRFDRDTGSFEQFLMHPDIPKPSGFLKNRVRALEEDRSGVLWVATNSGLFQFDKEEGSFKSHLHDPENPHSLMNNDVRTLYKDSQGILWLGTFLGKASGLSRTDRTTSAFKLYSLDTSDIDNTPRGMYLDHDGILWVGSDHGLLNRFDRGSNTYSRYPLHEDEQGNLVPSGAITAIHRDRQGLLWVGSWGIRGGLSLFDEKTKRFTHYHHDPNDVSSLAGRDVLDIYEDKNGALWVGTNGGLNRFDPVTGTFFRYPNASDTGSPHSSSLASAIFEDHEGTLWIGTRNGINRYDKATDTFVGYRHEKNDSLSINSGIVMWIYERPEEPGILWIGINSGGLDRFDVKTGQFSHYTSQRSDLPNNTVHCVLSDDSGYLWMSTNRGLARLNPDINEFKVFTTVDGLQKLEFDFYSCHKGYNGELFFGGQGGVNAILPGKNFTNPFPPEVVLTDFRLFNQRIVPGPDSPLERSITETKSVILPHDKNDISLDYVGLHFTHPEKNRYTYMLEGYDEDWRAVDTKRQAAYTNLPHGNYAFHLKASNSDGIWSEDKKLLEITILPPWWQTWWAYVIYGLCLLAGIVMIERIQRRRLIAKEREKTRERELAQAKEIEKAYTQLKTTQQQLIQKEKLASLGQLTSGIAHEIKNPLNFVNNFARLNKDLVEELREAIEQGDDVDELLTDLGSNAHQIEKHGDRADQIVRGMMQHASRSEGKRYDIAVNTLVDEFINLSYHSFTTQQPDTTIQINRDFSDQVGSLQLVPQDIGRVLQNILNNAFDSVSQKKNESEGDYTPTVTVRTTMQNGQVEISIGDNGSGIPREIKDKIFEPFFTTKPTGTGTGLGLSLSYDIITQGHGGSLTAENKEGEGATFIITLSD